MLTGSAVSATIGITSSRPDLGSIQAGDLVQFSVAVEGLAPDEQVAGLAATVLFDGSDFAAQNPTAGPIVPSPPADPLDFVSFADAGIVDGAFLTLSAESPYLITGNGVFYHFNAEALRAATGTFRISFAGLFLLNPNDPARPTEVRVEVGSPLTYRIVPEPSMTGIIALAAVWSLHLRRRSLYRRMRESR